MQPPAVFPADPPPDHISVRQPRQPQQHHQKQQHRQQQQQQQQQHRRRSNMSTDEPDLSLLASECSTLTDLSASDSELSSVGSLSPPPGYLSPVSSQSATESGLDAMKSKKNRKRSHQGGENIQSKDGEEPVRKKRRSPEPKPRTRQTLDVRVSENVTEQEEALATLLKVLRKHRKIVVVAGAGISVSAGIPDFRSATGLFKSLKSEHKLKASGKALFDASVYQTDSSTSSFHDMVRSMSSLVTSAQPTLFHRMLERLGDEGRLLRLYTQNVDGIDTSLPSLATSVPLPTKGPWPRAVQLHGGLEKMVCTKCHHLSTFEPDLFSGPAPPPCNVCIEADKIRTDHAGKRSHGVGRLRPRMVLYNEHNPDEEAIGSCMAADLRARPDAIIVVGTTMKIPGVRRIVREMCGVVRSRRDGVAIWMNHDDPPPGKDFEDIWDLVIKGPCDEVARQWTLADQPGQECSSSDVEHAKERAGDISVLLPPSPTKKPIQLVTPASTPEQFPVKTNDHIPKIMLKLNPPRPDGKPAPKKPGRKPAVASTKVVDVKKATISSKSEVSGSKPARAGKVGRPLATVAKRGIPSRTKRTTSSKATTLGAPAGEDLHTHFQVAKSGTKQTAKSKKTSNGGVPKKETREMNVLRSSGVESETLPQTPLRVEIPNGNPRDSFSRRSSLETISPTSVPKGMADLLT